MKYRMTAFLALGSLLLAACATVPAPLQGEFAPVTPREAVERDVTGVPVRWGGRLIAVEPQDNRTCFQLISTRLTESGRPYWGTNDIGGRFIACRPGFYDPAIFERNREVTFTGRVAGYETRQIGGYEYRLPRLDADVVYLWPVREEVDVVMYRPAPWPWWGWWHWW